MDQWTMSATTVERLSQINTDSIGRLYSLGTREQLQNKTVFTPERPKQGSRCLHLIWLVLVSHVV